MARDLCEQTVESGGGRSSRAQPRTMASLIDFMLDPGWRYLRQAADEALKEQAERRFDNKTHTWVPDAQEGFVVASISVQEGNNYTLALPDGSQKKLTKEECQEINPAKYEKTEDMSNLTFLNEASVLHNLRQRYYSMMIYTYSGLFCVFVNPYKMLPIYTDSVAAMYVGKRRSEMPPHLFAVADEAFRNMMNDHENQSMLITGESGAGKTENTKKVIAYFANIGGAAKDKKKTVRFEGLGVRILSLTTPWTNPHTPPYSLSPPVPLPFYPLVQGNSLEDQVVQANPAIEAFGNGATVRNYNSSRFGKFIRIHFDKKGKLVGGDIEHYLLEKSRVIKQAPGERSYHIFYQIMSQKKLRDRFNLEEDIHKYHFSSQAEVTVPGMDDKEEWRVTDNSFDVMSFSEREKDDLYKGCAAIMHMGNMKFKQKPREEQGEVDGMEHPEKAARLFGVNPDAFVEALTRPKIKVGTEWVVKGQNVQQVDWAVGALAKAVYARIFTWLISRVNETLSANIVESEHYIGVLDIAGFEIFDRNSFEQLWINFVNEKLQQFFNHHMFVLEQEEYAREGIQWTFIDFGLDLQACIELIEKPLGIVSMLDEECIVPKATDMTYVDKLTTQHLGKHPNFQKAKPPKGKQAEAHFAIVHYAGTVRYNAEQWLDKNKDPLNDSAVAVLKTTDKESMLFKIWENYQTELDREEQNARGKGEKTAKKKGKSASFMTVSTMYRESLNKLMSMLHTTHPHFIRCIIPNEKKQSGVIDAPLVLNQLTCNGVLEGIRICRKGFPNRMTHADFRFRYAVLAADEATDRDQGKASEKILAKLCKENKVNVDNYRMGNTKVFFRAGMLAHMEELRDEAIAKMVVKLQCACRHYLATCGYKRRLDQEEAYGILHENIRQWLRLRSWPWFRLYTRLKPMLKGMRSNAEVEALEKKVKELEKISATEEAERKRLADELRQRDGELDETKAALARERMLMGKRNEEIDELNKNLKEQTEKGDEAAKTLRDMEKEMNKQRKEWSEKEKRLEMEADAERKRAEAEAARLGTELDKLKTENDKLAHTRKSQELANAELMDRLDILQDKYDRADEQRLRMREDLDAVEDKLLAETRAKDELTKVNKKLEQQLKTLKNQLELLTKDKHLADLDCKRREEDIGEYKLKAMSDANLIAKLQQNLRRLIDRIEELEEELENERRNRTKSDRIRVGLQSDLDVVTQQMEEASGQLNAQQHINKSRAEELANLHRELEKRSLTSELYINDLCSMQYATVNNLRNLSAQAASLEHEANRVLDTRHALRRALPAVYVNNDDSDMEASI